MSCPPHEDIFFLRNEIPHPIDLGFHWRFGEPRGQLADYGLSLRDGSFIGNTDVR